MAFGKQTYNSSNELRESLLDIIKDISPNEGNYFVSNLGKGSPAMQKLHQWNLFHEDRVSSVTASIEGAETSYPDLPAESRASNYTVTTEAPVKLSRTRASIANVTGEDALGVEKERALRRLKNQMEYLTVNGVVAAGSSGVASTMAGLEKSISTNVTAMSSGQSFTEQILNDMVNDSWNKVGGSYVMNMIAAPVVIKRRVATFGTNLTRNVNAMDKRLTREVRVYDSEVGQTVMIIAHKDIRTTAGSLLVLGLNDSLFEYSFLAKSGEPHWEDRAQTGDWKGGTYITEFTLVSYEESASVKRTGFSNSL